VQADELAALELSISVLDLPRPAPQLGPEGLVKLLAEKRPGVVLEYLGRRSTFLPSVWEEISEVEPFLSALCRKQGSDPGCWRASEARVELYGAQSFGEKR
jgi:AMMECR1 domain-containing protein